MIRVSFFFVNVDVVLSLYGVYQCYANRSRILCQLTRALLNFILFFITKKIVKVVVILISLSGITTEVRDMTVSEGRLV